VTPTQLAFSPSTNPPYTSSIIYAFPTHLQLPYTLEWNVSVEQALGSSQSMTMSYVGSNGRRLLGEQELSLSKSNPNFGYVFYFPNGITSNYQALQVKFQRSVTRGVHALTSYTWSHSIDLGSTASALPLTRGNSDFDVRHNFQTGLSWDITSKFNNRPMQYALSSWGLDGRVMLRTGFPVTLNGNQITDPATGMVYSGGVNLIPGRPIYLYGSQYPGRRAINGGPSTAGATAAFALPTGTSPGDAPRNFVRGFGASQVNLAIRRDFPIRETLHLQFRAETFNLLNHPNFGYVDSILTDALFGQSTQMLSQSLGTVASQYQQGGPRSMQFAMKLVF
jgi:hypothetical protein